MAGYLEFDHESTPHPCRLRDRTVFCGSRGLEGKRDFLFLNKGNGTFAEVAKLAGVDDPNGYYGFAAGWVDINDDGWVDLLVVNDLTPNCLYRSKGDGTFEDISYLSGFALSEFGDVQAGMGLAVGDYDNDGRVDLYLTHLSNEYNTLYRNEGQGMFTDSTLPLGLSDPSYPFVGWGTGFLDFDNDGFKDLFVANGHVYREADHFEEWGSTWAQRPLLFKNLAGRRFEVVPPAPDSGLALVVSARGAAFGDLDQDGLVDVVLNCNNDRPRVLKNQTTTRNHWIVLQLVGSGRSPRNATGATVFVTAGGQRQRGDVMNGGSYSSHSDLRLHFGLGSARRVDKIEILWPSGRRQVLTDLDMDRILKIEETHEPM